jgi:hypothetical protein
MFISFRIDRQRDLCVPERETEKASAKIRPVEELEERRLHACRLTPDRALESLEDTHEFLRDRGLLTRTQDSALPSFFAACHEAPYAAGSTGFGSWPATKYPWYSALAAGPDVHELRIHNGKSILLTNETLALVDPICRAELARVEAEGDWASLLSHLTDAGPSSLDDLQTELGLKPKELKLLRVPLERCGAVVSRSLRVRLPDGGHLHTSELLRYDQAFPRPAPKTGGVDALVVAAVRAAVLAPEREVTRKWFSWRWLFEDDLVDRLVSQGRLERPEPGWVAVPASA